MSKDMSYEDIAIKLHRQFGHRSAETIIKLLKAAGKDDVELKNQVIAVTKKCDICKVYKKAEPRPVVGLPLAVCCYGSKEVWECSSLTFN